MSWFNSALANLMPYTPRWAVRPFARPYVAGETTSAALSAVRSLNNAGYAATLDILGEHVHNRTEAELVRSAYVDLLGRIKAEGLNSTISLKLTHLGLELEAALAHSNLLSIVRTARELDIGLTIDMENSPYTDITLDLYREARTVFPKVGTVLQAYLHRSLADLKALESPQLHLRICKGIYREDPAIALQDKQAIRDNFFALVQALLKGPGFAAIATHDRILIDTLETWIEQKRIAPRRLEFQVLYGVPMGDRLQQLRNKGYGVRMYVPYGEAWYDYSVRRLKENPNIVGYVLKNILQKN